MKCVVLDLDETIVHCHQNARPEDVGNMPCFEWMGMTVVLRPHFKEFISFLFDHFDHIYVFTAAQKAYAEHVMEMLAAKRFVKGVWTRDDCKIESAGQPGQEECFVYKPLQGKMTPCGSPLDSPYTIMIDDRDEVTHMNLYAHCSRGSHYKIAPFMGDPKDRGLLDCMQYVTSWINSLPGP